jgi:hypothetical protein
MATLEDALAWRSRGYAPYRLVRQNDQELELISYPYPEDTGVFIQVREFNNPATMVRSLVSNLFPIVQALTVRELRNLHAYHANIVLKEKQIHPVDQKRQANIRILAEVRANVIAKELIERQKEVGRILLEYADLGGRSLRALGSLWYSGSVAPGEAVQAAYASLTQLDRGEMPKMMLEPMKEEIHRLRLALLEWLN